MPSAGNVASSVACVANIAFVGAHSSKRADQRRIASPRQANYTVHADILLTKMSVPSSISRILSSCY